MSVDDRPVIRIEYCSKCRWMIRASWLAQEFLSTFENELGGVTIAPAREDAVFDISIGDELLWSRKAEGRFPQIKEIKKRIRDRVAPGRDLGHIDKE